MKFKWRTQSKKWLRLTLKMVQRFMSFHNKKCQVMKRKKNSIVSINFELTKKRLFNTTYAQKNLHLLGHKNAKNIINNIREAHLEYTSSAGLLYRKKSYAHNWTSSKTSNKTGAEYQAFSIRLKTGNSWANDVWREKRARHFKNA